MVKRPRALFVIAAALAAALLSLIAFVTLRLASPSPASSASGSSSSDSQASSGSSTSDPSSTIRTGVAGHVRNSEGAPIGDAMVCASATSCTTTSADGAYQLDGLPSDLALAFVASASGRAPSMPVKVNLTAGERREGVDLVLDASGAPTRGRVRDALGGVVAGASVVFSLGDGKGVVGATTDGRGEFTAWVGTGYLSVTATSPGYATAAAYGHAPDRFFELSLVPGAGIAGRAIDRKTNAGVASAKIDAVALDGGKRQTVTSGEDGAFHIEGLTPGRYHLEGLAPQLSGYSRTPVLLSVGENVSDVIVELELSPSVTGRVLEANTRAPCPGGEVTLRDKRSDEYAHAPIESDGSVKMIAVLPGTYDVEVSCEGHATPKKLPPVIVRDRPIEGVEWEVDRGTYVSGLVVDVDGKPVANATVTAMPESYEEGGGGEATTDARGHFVLKGLGPTKYTLSATASGTKEGRAEIELGRRDRDDVRIALGRGASIAGKVTDVDGAPIAGATVQLSGQEARRVDTSADGSFSASGLAPGSYRLGVRSDDSPRRSGRIGSASYRGKSSGDLVVTVKEGETSRASLVLERRSEVIEGVVVDAKGAPLSDFFVEAARLDNPRASASRYDGIASGAVTDPMGRFRIEKLGAGEYSVRAFRPGGAEGIIARTATGSRVTVKIVSGSLSGIVTARGVRQERFHVSVNGPSHRSETLFHTNGAFTMRDLTPGEYEVSVKSSDGTASTKVTVAEDGVASVKLSLEREVEATD